MKRPETLQNPMTEDFLHFIWKFGLFERYGIVADTGDEIEIAGLGEHNTDAGPDFLNVRIKIGSTTWAGNAEIHLRSSDWTAHRHHTNKAYNNVILHVVHRYDEPVKRANGEIVPTIILKFDNRLYDNYCNLVHIKNGLSCHRNIEQVDPLIIDVWLNSLVVERLQQKTRHIQQLLDQYKNNWEEVLYISLARAFGFGLNATPFEMTARSLPFALLMRHRDSLKQTEALIMGQAGFLGDAVLFNSYYVDLRNEYMHLRNKYKLKPVDRHLWKFMRLRPVNFPTIRLAQFAALLQQSEGLFSKITESKSLAEISNLFGTPASEFWDTHYTFETPTVKSVKKPGTDSVNTIIINTVVPFLFIYGKTTGNDNLKEKTLAWLNEIPAENNRIVRRWEQYGIGAPSAFYSQGLLQLSNMYCSRKRCLACSIGSKIITS